MIHIEARVDPMPVAANAIQAAAREALAAQRRTGDLTVVLTDDAQIRELNKEYLDTDASTDVLSFPADEKDPETGGKYLGDVVISVPQADIQARVAGHPLKAELQLLVVHGVLHLLGHDHARPADKKRMWAVQGRALKKLGLAKIQVRE